MTTVTKIDTPNATNGLPPLLAFGRRKRYINKAYPLIEDSNGIDFWYGNQVLFGKIDKEQYPIIVKEEFIKQFDSNPEYRALNFVVDAFEALLDHIKAGFSRGAISAIDTFLLNIGPVQAYEDPIEDYQNVLTSTMAFYASSWVDNLQGSVRNFDDFVDHFLEFSDVVLQKSPITLSDYIISDYCPHRFTGLVVEFKNFDYGDDKTKWEEILQDKNFDFFQNAVRKFGFKIDYNAPWRLVADVTTGEMKRFMASHDINSVENLFEQYFERAKTKDVDFLRAAMLTYYSTLVARAPEIKIPVASKKDTSRTTFCRITRKPLLTEEIPGDKFWLEFYFRIRMKEAGIDWEPPLVKNKIKYLKRLYDLFDIDRAMRYIDHQIFQNARG